MAPGKSQNLRSCYALAGTYCLNMAISEKFSSKSGYFGGLFFPEKWENLEWLYLYIHTQNLGRMQRYKMKWPDSTQVDY